MEKQVYGCNSRIGLVAVSALYISNSLRMVLIEFPEFFSPKLNFDIKANAQNLSVRSDVLLFKTLLRRINY